MYMYVSKSFAGTLAAIPCMLVSHALMHVSHASMLVSHASMLVTTYR